MAGITGTAQEVIAQLKAARGNISNAAIRLNTSRETLRKYLNEYPTVKAALVDIKEASKDRAEEMLESRMETSDTLLIFYLKTQAYDRGYGDKSHMELSGEVATKATVTHGIDSSAATNIFDILASIGAIPTALDDAKDDQIHTAQADA